MADPRMGAQWQMPRVSPRPWGLLTDVAKAIPADQTSANFPDLGNLGPNRMKFGVAYTPWGCQSPRWGDSEVCVNEVRMILEDGDEAGDAGDPGFSPDYTELDRDYPETVYQRAFRMADALACSDLSVDWAELERRVGGRVDLLSSEALALQLSRGWATDPVVGGEYDGEGNHSLSSDATTLTPISASIEHALIAVDEWLATVLHNGQGVIHVSPGILSNLMGQSGAKVVDGQIITASGHLVAADAGYVDMWGPDASGPPVADSRWIYASGPIWYQFSDRRVIRDEAHITTRNELRVFGEIFGIALYDPCTVGAVLVDLAPAA